MHGRDMRMRLLAVVGTLLLLLAGVPSAAVAAPDPASAAADTYILTYASPAEVDRAGVQARGYQIVGDLGEAGVLIVRASGTAGATGARGTVGLASLPGVAAVARDRAHFRVPDEPVTPALAPEARANEDDAGCASTEAACPLQWDLERIGVPEAWRTTRGAAAVRVAVLDTGLNSRHEAVGPNYDRAASRSFVRPTPACPADQDTAESPEDFHGHGTWTGTHVAGANGRQMTGIAPEATLVNLRVLGACGFGQASWILSAMVYARQIGVSVVNMSLGGYACADGVVRGSYYCGTAADAEGGPEVWQAFTRVVQYLLANDVLVVAAAGNEHVRLDARGRVASAGSLAACTAVPPQPHPCQDLRGLSELPAGVPGVLAVAATNRVTAAGAPGETRFGQFGVGRRDQLAYYSNYGERIDVAAPGGARNYNVPSFDCLSAECARLGPSAPGATDNPGAFGAWAVDPAGEPCATCYVHIQGTSMAAPQVAGVAALALAANPGLTAAQLARLLRRAVTAPLDPNATPAIAANPYLPTYNYDLDYFGAPGIPERLLGAGIIDAPRAVRRAGR